MLFSLVGLSGCGVSDLRSQIDGLRDLMQEQEGRIAELEGENGALRASELALYKRVAKLELEGYAAALGEANYFAQDWAEIVSIVAEGKEAIDAAEDKAGVDLALAAAKAAIDEVLPYRAEVVVGDFKLIVSVDKTSASVGDEIAVTATLKNLSGRDLDILFLDFVNYYPNYDPQQVDKIENLVITSFWGGLNEPWFEPSCVFFEKDTEITVTRLHEVREPVFQLSEGVWALARFYFGTDRSEQYHTQHGREEIFIGACVKINFI